MWKSPSTLFPSLFPSIIFTTSRELHPSYPSLSFRCFIFINAPHTIHYSVLTYSGQSSFTNQQFFLHFILSPTAENARMEWVPISQMRSIASSVSSSASLWPSPCKTVPNNRRGSGASLVRSSATGQLRQQGRVLL